MVEYGLLLGVAELGVLIIGVIVAVRQLGDIKQTRQTELFMSLFETYRSPSFRRASHQVLVYDWKDFDDWAERYNERTNPEAIPTFNSVILFYEGIGVLVRKGFIDVGLVYELLADSIKVLWKRYEPIFLGDRELFQNPRMWDDFEYLYNMIKEIDEYPESTQRMSEYFQQLSQQKA